jgi:hypothetical protein
MEKTNGLLLTVPEDPGAAAGGKRTQLQLVAESTGECERWLRLLQAHVDGLQVSSTMLQFGRSAGTTGPVGVKF